jgi:hypothetical protein
MPASFIYGSPRFCCNTNCKFPFNKKSHLGWLPHCSTAVYAILQCPQCKSKFKVSQHIIESINYFLELPDVKTPEAHGITQDEINNVKKLLGTNKNLLEIFNDGIIPGVSSNIKPSDYDKF